MKFKGEWEVPYKRTLCPKCGEPPQYVIGPFLVRVYTRTGERSSIYSKPMPGPHEFECGGGHLWPAEPEKDDG